MCSRITVQFFELDIMLLFGRFGLVVKLFARDWTLPDDLSDDVDKRSLLIFTNPTRFV
jgi:hypothetical protein